MTPSLSKTMTEQLGRLLLMHNLMLATAESCTGGGLTEMITQVPGSSTWFERGFVSYSNNAKQEMLGVDHDTLNKHGAVSEQTACAMAEGALTHSQAQVSVAITGIAGPDGGTEEKPVGTVCLAWQREGQSAQSVRVLFEGDRQQVRRQACLMALQGLIDLLEI